MNRAARIPAFAKVNLCLYVLRRREDDYHELRTIFQTISLHDSLELTLTSRRGIRMECSGEDVPAGPENLAWRAIDLCCREWKLRRGVHLRLTKRIPAGRGLGGGSSDAAAAIIGMLRLVGRRAPFARLVDMAASLGSDVPFFLFGGRALGAGRGEEIYPLPEVPQSAVLVVSPRDIAVRTPDAYAWLSPALTNRAVPSKMSGFRTLCWSPRGDQLPNDFEAVVFRRRPRLQVIRRGLLRHGAVGAALAGSGSAVFGVFRSPAQARRTARLFPDDQVFVAKTLTRIECARAWHWRSPGSPESFSWLKKASKYSAEAPISR